MPRLFLAGSTSCTWGLLTCGNVVFLAWTEARRIELLAVGITRRGIHGHLPCGDLPRSACAVSFGGSDQTTGRAGHGGFSQTLWV